MLGPPVRPSQSASVPCAGPDTVMARCDVTVRGLYDDGRNRAPGSTKFGAWHTVTLGRSPHMEAARFPRAARPWLQGDFDGRCSGTECILEQGSDGAEGRPVVHASEDGTPNTVTREIMSGNRWSGKGRTQQMNGLRQQDDPDVIKQIEKLT